MIDIVVPSDYERAFSEFLGRGNNMKKLQDMIAEGGHRLKVNLDELRQINPNFVQFLLSNPAQSIKMMSQCIKAAIADIEEQEPSMKEKKQKERFSQETTYDVAFEGNFGRNHITPRGLIANIVGQLVNVQGIVTRLSLVKPKLLSSVHYCEKTESFSTREFCDPYDISCDSLKPQTTAIPTKDRDGNPMAMEYGLCKFKDFQTVVLQEMPERTPPGQLPRSIEVILEKELVDKAKPGDRIDVVGIYRAVNSGFSAHNGIFKTILLALNLSHINDIESNTITEEDVANCQELSKRKDLFKLLSESIAPCIEGHQFIKQALLLQLLGGVEKDLESGTHLRGDINILLVGDPSTGKSQLLRSVMNIASLAISTTGRGSTGVGLTAAVIVDKETRERHLEAGAMVLGDRGIVCIDEFDKMSEIDRVAIHEVMEQQTVTIAKAGIYTSLNARCSVLAAANPIYGEYVRTLSLSKNISLPDTLLSRFDLLFVTLDEKVAETDRKIAQRVILNHRYKSENEGVSSYYSSEDNVIEPDVREESGKESLVFEKYNGQLYGQEKKEIVSKGFLRKYIAYAKKRALPKLTNDAVEYVSSCWSKLRPNEDTEKSLPITVRTLETLIRLATAHAKCRLGKEVLVEDCEVAEKLLKFAVCRKEIEERTEVQECIDKTAVQDPIDKTEPIPKADAKKTATNGTKKKKIDLIDDVETVVNLSVAGQESFASKEKQFVYQVICKRVQIAGSPILLVEDLWQDIQKTKKADKKEMKINCKKDLVDVVLLLDFEGKVAYSNKENTIVLI